MAFFASFGDGCGWVTGGVHAVLQFLMMSRAIVCVFISNHDAFPESMASWRPHVLSLHIYDPSPENCRIAYAYCSLGVGWYLAPACSVAVSHLPMAVPCYHTPIPPHLPTLQVSDFGLSRLVSTETPVIETRTYGEGVTRVWGCTRRSQSDRTRVRTGTHHRSPSAQTPFGQVHKPPLVNKTLR